MLATIFTPTYNRAYRLSALYESLCKQSFRDFEWLIVDDGSSDNTKELVKGWIVENKINIRYIFQSNGGKHRAINRGVNLAKGILFFIVDSDDILPQDSIERINNHYLMIKDRDGFGGICGLKAYYDGSAVGNQFDFGIHECTNFEIDYKYKLTGDMAEVFYTSVLKEFPFPEIEGEKFCPEILVWNRIATKYKIHYFSENIYYCEYLEDGLTSKITKIRIKSPIASSMTYAEMIVAPIPFRAKIRAAINYWRFSLYASRLKRPKLPFFWHIAKPIGYLIFLRESRNN